MKYRIGWALAVVATLVAMLAGTPVGSAQAQTTTQVSISVQAQTTTQTPGAVQVPQATQTQIPWDCAKYNKRAVICLNKATKVATVLDKGKVEKKSLKYDRRMRFGGFIKGVDHRTPNGTFDVHYYVKDGFSNKYFVDMPFYIKFMSDGIGIHYSEDFDLYGKAISHGCAGTKSKKFARYLFYWAQDHDPLIVVTAG